jgi:hypothetical protein
MIGTLTNPPPSVRVKRCSFSLAVEDVDPKESSMTYYVSLRQLSHRQSNQENEHKLTPSTYLIGPPQTKPSVRVESVPV